MTETELITDKSDAPATRRRTSCSPTTRCSTTCWSGPATARLWRLNEPDTLRYLVVDELHTFDGAQGADLACLIRRVKERVQDPAESSLLCRHIGHAGRGKPRTWQVRRAAFRGAVR